MGNFPNWTPFTATNSMSVLTFANIMISNIVSAQKVITSVAQAQYTLKNYTRMTLDNNGNLVSLALLSHDALVSITANQHHNQIHASTHISSADPVVTACATHAGLMSAQQRNRLYALALGATRNRIKCGSYIGDGAISQQVTVGFNPRFLKIYKGSTAVEMSEYLRYEPWLFRHHATGHSYLIVSNYIIVATVMAVFGTSLNTTNIPFTFIAME